MTKTEHVLAHQQLHRQLDILAADFIRNTKRRLLSKTSVMELIKWSNAQCDPNKIDHEEEDSKSKERRVDR